MLSCSLDNKRKLYGSLGNKRLKISESKASRVIRVVNYCLHLSWKSLFHGHKLLQVNTIGLLKVLVDLLLGMSLYCTLYPCNKSLISSLGYDLNRSVIDSSIFTEIARLPNSLLFLPAHICCADKIKLICAQQNDSMQ